MGSACSKNKTFREICEIYARKVLKYNRFGYFKSLFVYFENREATRQMF
jgi:hypothetical protein